MTSLVSLSGALLDQLYALGVTRAFMSPGSRSTPLVIALSRSLIGSVVCLDERACAFGALGYALKSQEPVLVVTTSGTATAELRPALTEAFASGVPLIVVTADRPLRLQSVGASQTIDQPSVLRDVTALSITLEFHGGTTAKAVRQAAVTLVSTAIASPRASCPVHANIHFDEPLLTEEDRAAEEPRRLGTPTVVKPSPFLRAAAAKEQRQRWFGSSGLLLCGRKAGLESSHIESLVNRGDWGVIADPFAGSSTAVSGVLHYGDLVLREKLARELLVPETLVRVGIPAVSRVVSETITHWHQSGTRVISIPAGVGVVDPEQVATEVAWVDFGATVADLEPVLEGRSLVSTTLDALQETVDSLLERDLNPRTEMAVARQLYRSLGQNDWLMTAASMPLRLIEWFAGSVVDGPSLHANRGANGIDGTVATFLGAAQGVKGLPVLLIGDLSFLYDLTALIHLPLPSRGLILVLDNDGGAIFDHVPHARWIDERVQERFFVTPHRRDLVRDIAGLGIGVERISDSDGLKDLLAGAQSEFVVGIFESVRSESLAAFRAVSSAVTEAVAQALGNLPR